VPDVHTNPVVRGAKVYLRPLEREDAVASNAAINDREIAHLTGFPFPVDRSMSERWYDEEVAKTQGTTAFAFAICKLGSAQMIGGINFHRIHHGLFSDVGIFMFHGYEGKGFGTDAMNALIDFGFGELRLQRIGLEVDPDNERAIRSYEKCGFAREGVRRAVRHHRGQVMDALAMSIIRSDWEKLERKRSWDYPAPKPPVKKRRPTASRS
jgi:RimJ/RimL family protein N-acetyltransferase